jgi:hypothetical protein
MPRLWRIDLVSEQKTKCIGVVTAPHEELNANWLRESYDALSQPVGYLIGFAELSTDGSRPGRQETRSAASPRRIGATGRSMEFKS